MTKPVELRNDTTEELQRRLSDAQAELFNLRSQQVMAQLENPARFRLVKREIARIKTVLHEKTLGINL